MNPEAKLVPCGILDVLGGLLSIFFGTSCETSDFIVDCIETWWDANVCKYGHIKELAINLDNGRKVFEKGVKLTKKEMKKYEDRIVRSTTLPKGDVTIEPICG